jgi:PIN domain nuclease of toxin-antitoxin system
MALWWIRALRPHVGAEAAHVSAEATWFANQFLRPSRKDYQFPDQAAEVKARMLLERALTPQQRRDLLSKRCFYVKGRKFNYLIREGHSGNVDQLDPTGLVICRLCALPLGRVPLYDVMLAQKLWIETDENMFLKKAAPYPIRY